MEQAIHLKRTVDKLDRALERLQDIQSILRGHYSVPDITDLDNSLQRPNVPQLGRFDELGGIAVDQSGDWRRWLTPAPLMHDALSEVVAASKFAKKTVDMVKVQEKQAGKSTDASYYFQPNPAILLHPSNRVNLPQSIMATQNDPSGRHKSFSKENMKTHLQSTLDLKDATKVETKGGFRSLENHRESREETSSSLQEDRCMSFTRVAPEEHTLSSDIVQLRALLNVEEAANDHHSHGDQLAGFNHNVQQYDALGQNMHRNDPINQGRRQADSSVKRSTFSKRALRQMEDKEKTLSRPAVRQDLEDIDSLDSSMASKSLCVQPEEIKSSRKKSWSFFQGKVSGNVVVMFPNPMYGATTPPTSTSPDVKPMINSVIGLEPLQEQVSTFPSTNMTDKAPPGNKACTQKREKIVRLKPCTTASNAQKPKLQPAPAIDIASSSKRASSKMQKWRSFLTYPPPTLIRRLPEAHEMSTISLPNVSVGRPQHKSKEGGEDRHTFAKADHDDDDCDSTVMERGWSFSNRSVADNPASCPNARRSSPGPQGGGHSFSFLSKHFHAWKMASKQDK